MKRLLTLLCLPTSLQMLAQSSDSTVKSATGFARDLGIFTQANSNPMGGAMLNVGVLYRKAISRKPGYWMRGGAGFSVGNTPHTHELRPVARDTALAIFEYRFDRGGMAFLGLERERRFTSNIFLFAAGELQTGYTTSRVDSSAGLRYYEADGSYDDFATTTTEDAYRVHHAFGGLQASVGARGYLKRFVVSLELLAQMRMGLLRERGTDVFDFSVGGFGYRTSIGYRF